MQRLSALLLLGILVTLGPWVFAEKLHLEDFKVLMNNGSEFVGQSATLDSVQLVGVSALGNRVEFAREDIKALYKREGNNAGDGLAIGMALGGLAGVLINAAYAEETGTGDQNPRGLRVVASYAAIGGLAGAIIGSKSYSWKTVDITTGIGIEPVVGPQYFGITLRF